MTTEQHADINSLTDAEIISLAKSGYTTMDSPSYRTAHLGIEAQNFNLVLEGGGFRGQFTAGVLDLFMDEGIYPHAVTGVSAGALNGANYCSGMRGRTNYLNTNYCDDWRYYSFKSMLITGDAFNKEFSFGSLLREDEPLDFEGFRSSPSQLYTVAANLNTGLAHYHKLQDLDTEMDYLRASASVPMISRVVSIESLDLLDGGICDSVPLEFSKTLATPASSTSSATKQVVVLTQDATYVKGPNKLIAVAKVMYHKYPHFIEALANRHTIYNEYYAKLPDMHARGEIFLIRPQKPVQVAGMEKDRRKLCDLYKQGYLEAQNNLEKLRAFLNS